MSHKCADIFKLQAYPVFQQLISTASEALNRFLQYMHSQTPFMKQETQMALTKAIVGIRNFLVNAELEKLLKEYETIINTAKGSI